MENTTKKECGWEVMRVWLSALEETARDFHGTRPKEFCMRAYEHATEHWITILKSELGIETPESTTIRGAIENYIQSGVQAGLFGDLREFEIEDLPSGGVKIKVLRCPYQDSCRDLLDRGFSLKTLTCARLGCFRAAVRVLAGKDCVYELLEVKPGLDCEGIIEPL